MTKRNEYRRQLQKSQRLPSLPSQPNSQATAAPRPPWHFGSGSKAALKKDFRTYAARSRTSAAVAERAQWAQQKHRPPTATTPPITMHLQCSQIGAIAGIAHSTLSKTTR